MLRMAQHLWKVTGNFKANGKIPVTVYQSKRSALLVAVADVPGPMVKGHISFGN